MLTKNGGVVGVRMENGHVIECEYVLNCAGMWARQLGAANGVAIPNQVRRAGSDAASTTDY